MPQFISTSQIKSGELSEFISVHVDEATGVLYSEIDSNLQRVKSINDFSGNVFVYGSGGVQIIPHDSGFYIGGGATVTVPSGINALRVLSGSSFIELQTATNPDGYIRMRLPQVYDYVGARWVTLAANNNAFILEPAGISKTVLLSYNALTTTRTFSLPNKSATFAMLDDLSDVVYTTGSQNVSNKFFPSGVRIHSGINFPLGAAVYSPAIAIVNHNTIPGLMTGHLGVSVGNVLLTTLDFVNRNLSGDWTANTVPSVEFGVANKLYVDHSGAFLANSIQNLSDNLGVTGVEMLNRDNSLSGSLNATGLNLQNQIDSLSGSLNNSYVNRLPITPDVNPQAFLFSSTFSSIPCVNINIEMAPNGEYGYLANLSGVSLTGFYAVYSEVINQTGYYLHIDAKSFS